MRTSIQKIYDNTNSNVINLEKNILNSNLKLDETELNIEIKHILEDMQSILDYIAVDIYKKYCINSNQNKIYFIYSSLGETELEFIKRINKSFPGLYNNYPFIYNIMSNTQSFNDNSNWLIKLNGLTNEVKHNELYINSVKKEKNISFRSDDTSMVVKGDLSIQRIQNGYGVFGAGAVYVGGNGNIAFYDDGTVSIGDGSYNVNDGKTHGVEKSISFNNIVKSKKYNEDIVVILKLIIDKERKLISDIEQYI